MSAALSYMDEHVQLEFQSDVISIKPQINFTQSKVIKPEHFYT